MIYAVSAVAMRKFGSETKSIHYAILLSDCVSDSEAKSVGYEKLAKHCPVSEGWTQNVVVIGANLSIRQ